MVQDRGAAGSTRGRPMGREAEGQVSFAGATGEARLLLEAEVLILRGALRARIARSSLGGVAVEGDDLLLATPDGPLRATLGARAAEGFARALAKPPPGLAEKLGVSADRRVFLLTPLRDAALLAALDGRTSPTAAEAALTLAELPGSAVLESLLPTLPDLPFWGATAKGRSAFPDAALRERMRAAGWIDSKSCAVSALLTATRYSRRH